MLWWGGTEHFGNGGDNLLSPCLSIIITDKSNIRYSKNNQNHEIIKLKKLSKQSDQIKGSIFDVPYDYKAIFKIKVI